MYENTRFFAASKGSTVAGVITNTKSRGCVPTYLGVGNFRITLDKLLDPSERIVEVTARTANTSINISDDTQNNQIDFQIMTPDTQAAVEGMFDVLVRRVEH